MKMALVLLLSHFVVGVIGFGSGIYVLPILTAPAAPTSAEVRAAAGDADFNGRFRRDLKGSDRLHWGEGSVSIGRQSISFDGEIAPGPDYKLYLSPEFVETEEDFLRLKPEMISVGKIRTFDNFIVALPDAIDPSRFNTVVVWCESFDQFITAARYQ